MKRINILFMLMGAANLLMAQRPLSVNNIDYASFLHRHDFVWHELPKDYYSGAIMGNGALGLNIYRQGNALKLHIGRVDVTEGRMPDPPQRYANLYHGARLPIGHFLLVPADTSAAPAAAMRLSLHDAITEGSISAAQGSIAIKAYVHARQNVIVLETSGSADYALHWQPLTAVSPRLAAGRTDYPQDYVDNPNPPVRVYADEGYHLSVQNLAGGKTYVVAWRTTSAGSQRRMLVTITHEDAEAQAIGGAKRLLASFAAADAAASEESHKQWWHGYYPSSYIAFPHDTALEAFYWRQIYKLACLTREDAHLIDLQGPWAVAQTPWPAVWANLNLQLTYSPLFAANRAALSKPLWKALNDNLPNLIENVGNPAWKHDAAALGRSTSYHMLSILNANADNKLLYEAGNLMWLMFYYHQYCTYMHDTSELRRRFFPLLRRAAAYYEHIRGQHADGSYHLPETASPEYTAARNCNYDLALLRWGLLTLMDINAKYKMNDSKAEEWADFYERLIPYPQDSAQGFLIGEGTPLAGSHRHYSHLLMIYPLCLVNWDGSAADRAVIERSVAHWQSMPQYLQGYSFTGSASMYALMGDGERAAAQLGKLLRRFIQPNTLYRESGPVIETPLAAAASLQEMYLQSWNGMVRVFPALPAAWQDACFINMRAEGGFLISAKHEGGSITLIQVEAAHAGIIRMRTGLPANTIKAELLGGGYLRYQIDESDGTITLTMLKGDIALITRR